MWTARGCGQRQHSRVAPGRPRAVGDGTASATRQGRGRTIQRLRSQRRRLPQASQALGQYARNNTQAGHEHNASREPQGVGKLYSAERAAQVKTQMQLCPATQTRPTPQCSHAMESFSFKDAGSDDAVAAGVTGASRSRLDGTGVAMGSALPLPPSCSCRVSASCRWLGVTWESQHPQCRTAASLQRRAFPRIDTSQLRR